MGGASAKKAAERSIYGCNFWIFKESLLVLKLSTGASLLSSVFVVLAMFILLAMLVAGTGFFMFWTALDY